LLFGSVAAVNGCAGTPPFVVPTPVGPEIVSAHEAPTTGQLIVYSAVRVSTYAQSEYPVHTPYTIYSLHDELIEQVDNLSGAFNQDPERVGLPGGTYHVRALTGNSGEVVVTVQILPGKTTAIDFVGGPPTRDIKDDQWVRLPDGRVIGWRADCEMNSCR
jgi:hypothetical protein